MPWQKLPWRKYDVDITEFCVRTGEQVVGRLTSHFRVWISTSSKYWLDTADRWWRWGRHMTASYWFRVLIITKLPPCLVRPVACISPTGGRVIQAWKAAGNRSLLFRTLAVFSRLLQIEMPLLGTLDWFFLVYRPIAVWPQEGILQVLQKIYGNSLLCVTGKTGIYVSCNTLNHWNTAN